MYLLIGILFMVLVFVKIWDRQFNKLRKQINITYQRVRFLNEENGLVTEEKLTAIITAEQFIFRKELEYSDWFYSNLEFNENYQGSDSYCQLWNKYRNLLRQQNYFFLIIFAFVVILGLVLFYTFDFHVYIPAEL